MVASGNRHSVRLDSHPSAVDSGHARRDIGWGPPVSALKVLPTTGKRYYELKNYGATHIRSDVLVFLDSDVIPEDGWLEALLEAIKQPGGRCGGRQYLYTPR